MGKGLGGEIKS